MHSSTKMTMGTIFAMVMIVLMNVAFCTPLRMSRKNPHRPIEETATARTVSPPPSPRTPSPERVDMMKTQ